MTRRSSKNTGISQQRARKRRNESVAPVSAVSETAAPPPEQPRSGGRPRRFPVWSMALLALAVAVIAAIVILKSHKGRVLPWEAPATPVLEYGSLIKAHADQASRRNANALQTFEMDLNRIVSGSDAALKASGGRAAKEASDYSSCCAVVYYLAWDKVKSGNETAAYLDGKIQPVIGPEIQTLATEIETSVQRLDSDLRRSTVLLARDLAALGPGDGRETGEVALNEADRADLDVSLRGLGFDAAGVGVSLVFDAAALYKSKIAAELWVKIAETAAKLFGKQVAKVAGSAVAAASDGPLPIGDILALGGMIWTGYDVYSAQQEFEEQVRLSLENMLSETANDLHRQAIAHANAIVKSYQEIQDGIGSQSAEALSKETP